MINTKLPLEGCHFVITFTIIVRLYFTETNSITNITESLLYDDTSLSYGIRLLFVFPSFPRWNSWFACRNLLRNVALPTSPVPRVPNWPSCSEGRNSPPSEHCCGLFPVSGSEGTPYRVGRGTPFSWVLVTAANGYRAESERVSSFFGAQLFGPASWATGLAANINKRSAKLLGNQLIDTTDMRRPDFGQIWPGQKGSGSTAAAKYIVNC